MSRNRHNTQNEQQIIPVIADRKNVYTNGEILNVPVRLRTESIYWAFPMDELLFSKWFLNFINLDFMPWDSFGIQLNTYLPDARNFLHEKFLKSNLNWMVMLDSDVLPPPNFIEKLMSHDKPMVGGWYRKKTGNGEPVVYDYVLNDKGIHWWRIRKEPGTGLEKVDGAGAGCWLMKKEVAEALGPKPYEMEHGGEDLDLCYKVNQAGFPIYIDWSIACAHAGVAVI